MARGDNNIVDRMIEFWAPGAALQRAADRHNLMQVRAAASPMPQFGGGYAGGSRSTYRESQAGFRSRNQGEDALMGNAYQRLQLNCMDVFRNSPVARAVVDGVNRYLGETRPRAATGDDKFDEEATDYFNDYWWNVADARRRVDFHGLEEYVTTCGWLMGDMVHQLTDRGLVPIEGLRITTPRKLARDEQIVSGIRFGKTGDQQGRITHFYVCDRKKGGFLDLEKFSRVAQNNAFFSHNDWRPEQVRGIPKFHGVVDMITDHDETHRNTVNKIKWEASLFSVERAGAKKQVQPRNVSGGDGVKTTYEQTAVGMAFKTTGKPGEDFLLTDGQTPNAQYVPTMEWQVRLVSAGTGFPYSMLMNVFTQASYMPHRAERVAMEMLLFREWRHRVKGLGQPAWNWAIARAINRKEIRPAPTKELNNGLKVSLWNRAEWSLPYVPEIDQGREEKARSAAFANVNATLSDWARARNTTLTATLDERDREIEELQKRANKLGLPLEQYAAGLLKPQTTKERETRNAS